MANVKISALPAATVINPADLLPVVQGGVTKQVTPDLLPLSAATAAALAGKDASGAAAAAQATAIQRANHTGTQSADTLTDGTTNKAFTATERSKLAGVAAGATANRTDAAVDTLLTGKADLVAGVIPTAQIPALALTTAVTVASQAAMLALTTTQVQPGDVAVRTDGAGTFILTATDPTVLGNWTRLNAPTDAVTSVNGQSGTVVLNAANVGADAAGAAAAAVVGLAPLASPAFTGSPTIGGAAVAKTTDVTAAVAAQSVNYLTRTSQLPLRTRDFPGVQTLPALAATPPTVGAPITNSTISGGVQVYPDSGQVTYYGPPPVRTANYPFGWGSPWQQASQAPFAYEFTLDSVAGKFEILLRNGTARILIDDAYATTGATFAPTADGSIWYCPVTVPAGQHKVRVEINGTGNAQIFGLQIAAVDNVTASPKKLPIWVAIGDSFTEPTIVDSGSSLPNDGWTVQASWLMGIDLWAAGSGGTGYLNPGSNGRVKFRDRLPEILAHAIDGVIWAGGINDTSFDGYSYAAMYAEALACFQQVKAAGVTSQIVLSPFTNAGYQNLPARLLDARDALRDAATAVGVPFVDVLELPLPAIPAPVDTTVVVQAGMFTSQVRVGAAVPNPCLIQIGTGPTLGEVRRVTNVSDNGNGTWTLDVSPGLANDHAVGEPVRQVGPAFLTGTGRQGTPVGDGTSDRYVGSDHTHPTKAGHRNIAIVVTQAVGDSRAVQH